MILFLFLLTIDADENNALDALQTLADLSLMLPDSTMESGKCLVLLVLVFPLSSFHLFFACVCSKMKC